MHQLISSNIPAHIKQFCAVLLRRKLGPHSTIWSNIDDKVLNFIQTELLQLVMNTKETSMVYRKVIDIICSLSTNCIPLEQYWPSLLTNLNNLFQSNSIHHKKAVLKILDSLAEYNKESLLPYLKDIGQMLLYGLEQIDSIDIKVYALKAIISLIISCTDEELAIAFPTNKTSALINIIHLCIQESNQNLLNETIDQFYELVAAKPTYLRSQLQEFVKILFEIFSMNILEPEIRISCIETLLRLLESAGGMLRNLDNFAKYIIEVGFWCLLQVSDQSISYIKDDEEEYDKFFYFGREIISRISDGLGSKIYITLAFEHHTISLLKSENWKERLAAIESIYESLPYCKDDYLSYINNLVEQLCYLIINDPILCIKQSAMNCISRMNEDYKENHSFQAIYHSQIYQALITLISQSSTNNINPNMIQIALITLTNFTIDIKWDIISLYFQQLYSLSFNYIQHFYQHYNQQYIIICEACINLINALYDTTILLTNPEIKNQISMNYNHLLPILIDFIMKSDENDEIKQLAAYAIDCLGILILSCNKDLIYTSYQSIITMLSNLNINKADDIRKDEINQIYVRICESIGNELFQPYLSSIIPKLWLSASINDEADIQLDGQEISKYENMQGYIATDINLRSLGHKKLIINTSKINEKTIAIQSLRQYVQIMSSYFYIYLLKTSEILLPLYNYKFQMQIREEVAKSIPFLLTCLIQYHLNHQSLTSNIIQSYWCQYLPILIQSIIHSHNIDYLNLWLESLSDSIATFSNKDDLDQIYYQLSLDDINYIFQMLAEQFQHYESRRNERLYEAKHSNDYDQERQYIHAMQQEIEDESMIYIYDVIAKIILNTKAVCMTSFHQYIFPYAIQLLDQTRNIRANNAGICIIDDIIEHGGVETKQYVENFIPFLYLYLDGTHDSKQSSCYGFGSCAKRLGIDFNPFLDKAIQALLYVINSKDSRSIDNAPATDCAISAIGKIIKYCLIPQNEQKYISSLSHTFIDYLPLGADIEESKYVHDELLCFFTTKIIYTDIFKSANRIILSIINYRFIFIISKDKNQVTKHY